MLDKGKKILLIGDANSIFISNYAKWLKLNRSNYQIDVFAVSPIKEDIRNCYDNIMDISKFPGFAFIDKLKGVRRFLLIFIYIFYLPKISKYEFVHFHFISPLRYSLVSLIKNFTHSKIVLSIWGSDMYRLDKWDENSFLQTCKNADCITFGNPDSLAYFRKKYSWTLDNLMHCRFGLAPLENLVDLTKSKEECKCELGWNTDKLSIVVGYNLSQGQQHLKILEQFNTESFLALKDKIELVLPLSYGGSQSYKNEIIQKLQKLPFPYFVYDKYLYDNDIARLRKASDIMIQLQITDQFSGSMQEHIFAGNVVVTGSWLPYQPMKDTGIYFEEVEELGQISSKLIQIVKDYDSFKSKTIDNERLISEMSRWKNTIISWTKIYEA